MVIWTDLSDITWDRTACLWCEKLNERDIRVSIAMISLGVKRYLGSLTVVKFLIHLGLEVVMVVLSVNF